MRKIVIVFISWVALLSCKKDSTPPTVTPVPDIIRGQVREIEVVPVDVNTPGQGSMVVQMNDALYKVQFNVTAQAQSNASLYFANDTLLADESREYGNFGQDVVAYSPLRENEILIEFSQGTKRIEGSVSFYTGFVGVFGRNQISQWRESNDPSKPNAMAREDIRNFISRYMDSNGDEAGMSPLYLSVSVARM